MALNKTLYRQVYQQYQQAEAWETLQRVRQRQPRSTGEAWQQYLDLVEFCQLLCPTRSQRHRIEKLTTLQTYYERIRQLEAWRQQHGNTA